MIGPRYHHAGMPMTGVIANHDAGHRDRGGATMMVAWRDRDAGTVVAGDGDAPPPVWTDRHLKQKSTWAEASLAGADRARNGAVSPISGILRERGAAGGGGGGRRGRGAGVSGTCILCEHDSPTSETLAGPVGLWAGGLYGSDLRSGNLAVLACAVTIVACCHTPNRRRGTVANRRRRTVADRRNRRAPSPRNRRVPSKRNRREPSPRNRREPSPRNRRDTPSALSLPTHTALSLPTHPRR